MKYTLFNPMITKEAKVIIFTSFIGLMIINLLTILFASTVRDGFVLRNGFYTLGFLCFSYFFVFKGHGRFRYFAGVFGALNFVVFYILTLVPKDAYGIIDTSGMNWVNGLDGKVKSMIYIVFLIIQLIFILLLFKSRAVREYMELAEKERKGIIVKG